MGTAVLFFAPPLRVDLADERAWLDGQPLRLGHKAFALLVALMQTPQKLVTKDELIDRVWEGRAVSDAVLTTAMRELRQALGDPARQPEFIETVHGRGYRFLKPVDVGDNEATSSSSQVPSGSAASADRMARFKWPAVAGVIVLGAVILGVLFAGTDDPDASANTSALAGTDNVAALESYVRARDLFEARSDLDRALVYARAAVAEDPEFAKGWELLAATAFVQSGTPTPEAQNAAATAIQLDPELSLAHAIRGVMGNIHPPHDWDAAISDLERAVELDPENTSALLWLGVEMRKLGYLSRAETLFLRCLEIDPAYHRCRAHLLWALHMNGKPNQAIAEYRRLVEDGAPPDDAVLLLEAIERGDTAFADEIVRSLHDELPLPDTIYDALKGDARPGVAAQAALESWLEAQSFNRRDIYPILLAMERYDLILVEQGSFFGLWLPEFTGFRQSDEFNRFVTTMQIDAYWREHGFPPQCTPSGETGFTCS